MPYVVALKPSHAWWAPADAVGAVWQVAEAGGWESPEQPGAWQPITRHYRDGQTETWWALEVVAGPSGPERAPPTAVIATIDPATLPEATDLVRQSDDPTNCQNVRAAPRPPSWPRWCGCTGSGMALGGASLQADQVCSLGWSQYQVRSDHGHALPLAAWCNCAFAFCWWRQHGYPAAVKPRDRRSRDARRNWPATRRARRGEKTAPGDGSPRGHGHGAAGRVALRRRARLVGALAHAVALLAYLVRRCPPPPALRRPA